MKLYDTSKIPEPAARTRGRWNSWVLWALLLLPFVIYLGFYSVQAKLNRGVIERHYGWQIWHVMSDNLPQASYPDLLRGAYWLLIAAIVLSFLIMLRLALSMNAPSSSVSHYPESDSTETFHANTAETSIMSIRPD